MLGGRSVSFTPVVHSYRSQLLPHARETTYGMFESMYGRSLSFTPVVHSYRSQA